MYTRTFTHVRTTSVYIPLVIYIRRLSIYISSNIFIRRLRECSLPPLTTTYIFPQVKKFICEWLAWLLRMRRPGCSNICDKRRSSKARTPDHEMAGRSSRSLLANVLDLDDDFGGAKAYCNGVTIENGGLAVTELSSGGASYQLKYILKELKVLTNKVKSDEEVADKCNDWKFAALVIDRLCLWMFTVFTVVSTMAIIFSAPHVIV